MGDSVTFPRMCILLSSVSGTGLHTGDSEISINFLASRGTHSTSEELNILVMEEERSRNCGIVTFFFFTQFINKD